MLNGYRSCASGCYTCDIVHNFFVAGTEQILAFGAWDEELKLREHEEFFVRMKRHGLRVGFCPEVRVYHWIARPAGYIRYRHRDYGPLAAQKMDVDQFTDIFGETFFFPRKAA